MMHDSKRSYIYWDGAEIAALARDFCDPSLNWIDPDKLAASKLDRLAVKHIWYAATAADSSREQQAQETLHKVLAARGVEMRIVTTASRNLDCSHCGYTLHDGAAASSSALVLGMLRDAAADKFDCAYIITNPQMHDLLAQHMDLLPSSKQVVMLVCDAVTLESARLPRLAQCGTGTRIQRPALWNRPRWMNAFVETTLTESGV
jgi:hypothetical protein